MLHTLLHNHPSTWLRSVCLGGSLDLQAFHGEHNFAGSYFQFQIPALQWKLKQNKLPFVNYFDKEPECQTVKPH